MQKRDIKHDDRNLSTGASREHVLVAQEPINSKLA